MSDRVERAVEAVNGTQPITRLVNSEMTREEQVQFARTLWENGGTATASGVPGVYTKPVGEAEVTFRTVNGERQVSDIVFRGKDIYDTPEETRSRQSREQAAANRPASTNRGIGSDSRYSTAPETPETAAAARTRQEYERCVDGSNRNSRVERAVCSDVTGYDVPGERRQPVQERTVIPTKPESTSKAYSLPQLELI